MAGSSWRIVKIPSGQSLLDVKSALPYPVDIVMYLGGADECHPRHVHAWRAYVVFLEER